MTMVNAFDGAGAARLGPEEQALLARRRRVLGPGYRLFYDRPVHPVRGEGVWLFEADGSRLLDAYNNVVSVGHCHPAVVGAIARQATILNTHTRYLDATILDYAERLVATLPGELSQVMFTCTGSEANDLALRVARHGTGRQGAIVTANAYHGVTEAAAELSPSLGAHVAPGPRVRAVPPPGHGDFVAGVLAAIADLDAAGLGCAALVVDSIMSSDGLVLDAGAALAEAAAAVRRAGGLYIADEVQAGFARTGEAMWGFARYGLVPDIVTMGKPMGNGHPVAAAVLRPALAAAFGESVRYFSTFGGNAVSCAAAAAVLDVIEGEGLQDNAARTGRLLAEGLHALAGQSGGIAAVRAVGLFAAADIVDAENRPSGARAGRIVNAMRERGVLISATGADGATLKIRPPLVFSAAHVDQLLEALRHALAA